MSGLESVDEKLTAAFGRREKAQELLIRTMTAIDSATTQIEMLLDEKCDSTKKATT